MSFRGIHYAVSEALKAISRNFLMSIASMLTSAISLTVLALVVLVSLGLHNAMSDFLQKSEIAVFTDKGISAKSVGNIKSQIYAIKNVKSIKYISADEAWKKMRKSIDIEIGGIAENPLPDSFRVKLSNPVYTKETAAKISVISGVEDVIEANEYVDKAIKIINIINILGIIATALFFIFAAFIISNTIRLTVYARRQEIKIMQMVGATNWFIRMPFLIEGATIGMIGGIIACLLTYATSHYAGTWATELVPILGKLTSRLDPYYLYGGIIVVGWIMGIIGTMISMQRYLRYEKL